MVTILILFEIIRSFDLSIKGISYGGLVTFITLGFLWFKRDLLRVSFYWICVAGILVLLASIFGAITVWTELEGLIVLIHLY